MSLANALLFGLGLAAMAIPLWVHLRLGKVKKRAVVPTLRLMRATTQTSRSPRRFVDIPLLLMRLLLLLLVALGFGRLLAPWLPSKDAIEHVALVLDVSGSMQAKQGEVWQQARTGALAALGRLHASSRVAVVLSPGGLDQPAWESPAQAIRRIEALSPGYGSNHLSAAIRTADQLLAGMPADHPKVLQIVSDFQLSAFVDIDRVGIPSDVELRVSKAGAGNLTNRGLSVEVLAAGISDVGLYGFSDGGNGRLKLDENGATRELEITAGQDAVRLSHSGRNGEWITRRISLGEDDALAADNEAWDVYQAQGELPVWLWEPTGAETQVYQQASYYLGRGLQPAGQEDTSAASRYRPIVLRVDGLTAAVAQAGSPEAPRLLLVPASRTLPDELVTLVRKLVDAGGAVVFFGGPDLNASAYESAWGPLLNLTPGVAGEYGTSPALAGIPESNPLWGGLDSSSRRLLEDAPLRVRHALETTGAAKVLSKYADGVPFVVESPAGKGRVFFVNTSANRAWGDWPASASQFVPALHLLAARALRETVVTPAQPPVWAGVPVTVRLAPEHAGKSLAIGDQRWPVGPQGFVKQVVFPKPGVTELTLDDGSKAGRIAVNFPLPESALECAGPAVVRQRLESLKRHGDAPAIRWEGRDEGGLAWQLCLLGAALLLLIEPAMANRRNPR